MQVIQECAAAAVKKLLYLDCSRGGKSGNFSAASTNLEIFYVVPIWTFKYGYLSVYFSIIYGAMSQKTLKSDDLVCRQGSILKVFF
jgi:hypothetical protein